MNVLELRKVSYRYVFGGKKVLDNIYYEFEQGKMYAIVGKSGAGKTTLLSLLSGLTAPTEGKIFFNGKDIAEMDGCQYRSQMVGVIFQSYNLLPHYNAFENVMLSLDVSEKKFEDKKALTEETLAKVGLTGDKLTRKILKLSGGEQQRVAIARAICYDPEVILADEPTGNLDLETQDDIMKIFKTLAYEHGKCIILVTHSSLVADNVDKIYQLAAYKE